MIRKHPITVSVSTALGVVLFSAVMAAETPANAQSALPPGTTSGISVPTISPGVPPFGDTLLLEFQTAVTATNGSNVISGNVTSAVFRSSSGFLDFAYQFTANPSNNVAIGAISIVTFQNVAGLSIAQTSDDIDGSGLAAVDAGGAIQDHFAAGSPTTSFSSASRPNANGDGINTTLTTGVNANTNAYTILVTTQATSYALLGSISVQGGGISAFTGTGGAVSPVPLGAESAPEPGALPLLVLAGVGPMLYLVRRKRSGAGSIDASNIQSPSGDFAGRT